MNLMLEDEHDMIIFLPKKSLHVSVLKSLQLLPYWLLYFLKVDKNNQQNKAYVPSVIHSLELSGGSIVPSHGFCARKAMTEYF